MQCAAGLHPTGLLRPGQQEQHGLRRSVGSDTRHLRGQRADAHQIKTERASDDSGRKDCDGEPNEAETARPGQDQRGRQGRPLQDARPQGPGGLERTVRSSPPQAVRRHRDVERLPVHSAAQAHSTAPDHHGDDYRAAGHTFFGLYYHPRARGPPRLPRYDGRSDAVQGQSVRYDRRAGRDQETITDQPGEFTTESMDACEAVLRKRMGLLYRWDMLW